MARQLSEFIRKDLAKKAVILSGPRQVGKTTLARELLGPDAQYLNYDILADRRVILSTSWKRECSGIVLDEIHKFPKWKNLLKGVIDRDQNVPPLLVTGSARLEVFRKAGDALTGRTFSWRLHPIDLMEGVSLTPELSPMQVLERLLKTGGFPESFFNPDLAQRLLRDRLDTVLREDLRDLSAISSLKSIELLVELLRDRIGGQIIYANLAQDLAVSGVTIKNWMALLERLYLIILLPPWSKKLSGALKKEPKCYFYDCAAAPTDFGARLENLVALCLLKYCHFERDSKGRELVLHYYRDKSGREVDFVVSERTEVLACIEVKTSDAAPSNSLRYLAKRTGAKHAIQLVQNLDREVDYGQIKIRRLADWLAKIAL